MEKRTTLVTVLLVFVLSCTLALAKHHTAEERGRAHFSNPEFAGGQRPCSTCHPDGKGLEEAGAKTDFSGFGPGQKTLEDVINICIVNASRGAAIDANSTEMQELVSYIKSLGTPKAPGSTK